MKFLAIIALLIIPAFLLSADITHEDQFSAKDAKVWATSGNGYDGDYTALDGDHTGTSSAHVRSYSESGELYLWVTVISQDDLAVLPSIMTFPKYERTRTDGTFKDHKKVEYIRFVNAEGVFGIIIGDTFYKQKED
jgi:hypothetical protein